MAQLGRFDYTVQTPLGLAASGASVTVYREGATVNGNQSGVSPLAVTVRHAGKIATGDTVFINATTGTTYSATRTSSTVITLSGFGGTLNVSGGDRITPSNSQPTLYGDDQGGASTSNPLTTSSTGRANCWMEFGAYDFVVSGGGTTTTAFTSQVAPTEAPGQTRFADAFAATGTTAGIQEAINDLPSGGGRVYIGDGTKTITSVVDLTALTNIVIELSQGCTVRASGIGNNPMFKVIGAASNVTIKGGTIDANSDAGECVRIGGTADKITVRDIIIKGADTAARSAIFLNGTTTNVNLRNIAFRNCEEAGIVLYDGSTASCNGLVIDNVDYDSTNGGGANASSSASCINLAGVVNDFIITNVRAQTRDRTNSAIIGIDDAGGALCQRGVISNVVGRGANATDANSYGIVLSKVNSVAVTNVSLENLGFTGIEVSEVLASANQEISISNVRMKNTGSNGQSATNSRSALSIANCRRVVCSNFVIEGSTNSPGRAINLDAATDCYISNFSIMNGGNGSASSSAIQLSSTCSANNFSNIYINAFAGDGVLNSAGDNNYFRGLTILNITDAGEAPISNVAGCVGNLFFNTYFSGNTLGITDTDDANYVEVPGGQTQSVTAVGNTLNQGASVLQVVPNGNYTLTSTPTLRNGQFDGQRILIVNVDTTNTLTLQDQGTLPSSNLRLGAATRALGPRDNISLIYSTTVGDWVEVGFVNVT